MSVVNGSCYLVRTLLRGDGAQGRAGVEVVEVEAQEAAAAELINQQGLALLKHIWVQHGHTNRREEKTRRSWKRLVKPGTRQEQECERTREKSQGQNLQETSISVHKPSLGDPQFIR